MPSTFMSLPRELRDAVYRELLSVESNCALDTGNGENRQRLVWNMEHPIFTVNKQILREALEAFHQENVLVSISANSCEFLRRHINKVIPVYYTGKKSFPDTALHIHLRHGHALSTKYWVESGCRCCEYYTTRICHRRPHKQIPRTEFEYAVFSAKHLPRLIQLINSEYASNYDKREYATNGEYKTPPLFGIDFSFSTSSKQYSKNQGLAAQLAEASGGLRIPQDRNAYMGPQGSDYDRMDEWVERYSEINELPKDTPKNSNISQEGFIYCRNIRITGLDSQGCPRLLEQSNLPAWSEDESIEEANRIRTQGDSLQRQGKHLDARSMYIIAGLMMNRWGFERLKRHGSVHLQMRVNDRAISTMVGIWMAASRSLKELGQCSNAHKTLGQNDCCCSCRMYLQWSKNRADAAKTTVQKHLDPRYWKYMTFPPSPEELEAAEMVLANYCQNCIEHGEWKEATSMLQHAVHKLPDSVQLQLMLAGVRSRAPKSDRKAKRRAAKGKRTVPKGICSKAEGPQLEEYFTADLFCVTPTITLDN